MAETAEKVRAGSPAEAPEIVGEAEGKVTPIYPAKAKAPTKPKPAPKAAKPKAKVDRVPAADVIRFIDELKISRSQLAQALGVSPSMVTEWVGKGRGQLMARPRWPEAQRKAKAFAKGLK